MEDFNAQIVSKIYKERRRKQTIHKRTNDNGQRLCDLATSSNLIISTKFKHKKKAQDNLVSTEPNYIYANQSLTNSKKNSNIHTERKNIQKSNSNQFMIITTIRKR